MMLTLWYACKPGGVRLEHFHKLIETIDFWSDKVGLPLPTSLV